MSIVEQQIAQSRDMKKAFVRKIMFAFVSFFTLGAIAVSFSHLLPITQATTEVFTDDNKLLVEKHTTQYSDIDRKVLQLRLTNIKSKVENTLKNSDLIAWDTTRSDELKSLVDDAYFEYAGSQ